VKAKSCLGQGKSAPVVCLGDFSSSCHYLPACLSKVCVGKEVLVSIFLYLPENSGAGELKHEFTVSEALPLAIVKACRLSQLNLLSFDVVLLKGLVHALAASRDRSLGERPEIIHLRSWLLAFPVSERHLSSPIVCPGVDCRLPWLITPCCVTDFVFAATL
jgi:hypothetical protein